jgi:hypothetical protein
MVKSFIIILNEVLNNYIIDHSYNDENNYCYLTY